VRQIGMSSLAPVYRRSSIAVCNRNPS